MRRTKLSVLAAAAALAMTLTACGSTDDSAQVEQENTTGTDQKQGESGADSKWFDQATFDEQEQQRDAEFEGDPEQPFLQYIDGEMTDTSEFKSAGPKKACFANASISNPWRQTGWITMNQQLKV
ncbi:MAG TPA: hypothetical protein VFJ28_11025, partial [Marmoricola sp.]|nr:hypothetical protein [Marmoricola sp.]